MADLEATARATPAADDLRGELKAFAGLALPMVISRLGVAAMGIVDGMMLARHSTQQLAVNGLAETLMGRLLEATMIFVTAGLALAAQARAGGDPTAAKVGRVWHNALLLAAGCAALGLMLGVLGGPVLSALGQPPELLSDASRVLWVLSLGVGPALVALVCAGLLEALGRPVLVAVAVVTANVLNAVLNQWFIFGGAGLPSMGAEGAAWSTTIVRVLLAAVLFGGVWWMREHPRYALRGSFDRLAWQEGAEQRQRGAAAAATVAVLALLSLALPVMAGWIGADAVAQITALFLALSPAMVMAWGLGDAAGLRVAALQGRDDGRGALRATGWRLAAMLCGLLAVLVAAYIALPQTLVRWAAHDPTLVAAVLPLLPLGLAALAADALSVFYSAMLRSLGVLRSPFVLHLITGLGLLPLAAGLAFTAGLGLQGLLAAHVAMAAVRAAGLAWLYDRHAARLDGARA